jgi:hypothetical protein
MVEHYTWERYQVELNGDVLCLVCAAKRYFDESRNWVDPRKVNAVVCGQQEMLFDPANGQLDIARCQHVLGVKQPLPAGLVFHDNAEFDSSTGHQISGEGLLEVIKRLDQPFCPVLDAAYQFAVCIGIYGAGAKQAIPAVVNCLNDYFTDVQEQAADILGRFGNDAKPVCPALVQLLYSPKDGVRLHAWNAFKQIDPEAAARAGVLAP